MFLDEAGVKATHVPYKGVGPMLTDLIGGQVEFGDAVAAVGAAAPEERRAARDRRRHGASASPAAPEIPTMVEQGMPNYLVEGWFAVIGPAKLPAGGRQAHQRRRSPRRSRRPR